MRLMKFAMLVGFHSIMKPILHFDSYFTIVTKLYKGPICGLLRPKKFPRRLTLVSEQRSDVKMDNELDNNM